MRKNEKPLERKYYWLVLSAYVRVLCLRVCVYKLEARVLNLIRNNVQNLIILRVD